jgi:hypothetical protein
LVEYLFIFLLTYSITLKTSSITKRSCSSHNQFYVSLHLFIQKLFRVENCHPKGQPCEWFQPHYRSTYLFAYLFNHPQNLFNYKRDSALSHDLFYVSLYLFIQKLFRVEHYSLSRGSQPRLLAVYFKRFPRRTSQNRKGVSGHPCIYLSMLRPSP